MLTTALKQPSTFLPAGRGQSLVEFVLVMPILVLILIGGFSFGLGTYEAHLTSDAVQGPAAQKLALSNNLNAVDAGTLQGMMNGSGVGGSLNTGALIDSVTVQDVNGAPYTSLMIGTKSYVPGADFVPGFDIHVAQVINRNLLQPAYTGGRKRPINGPLPAGIVPNATPW